MDGKTLEKIELEKRERNLEEFKQQMLSSEAKDFEQAQKQRINEKEKANNDFLKNLQDTQKSDEEKFTQAKKMLSLKQYYWPKAKNELAESFTLFKDRLKREALKFIKEVKTDTLASDAQTLQSMVQNQEGTFKQKQNLMQNQQQNMQNGMQSARSELEYEMQQAQIEWMQKKMEIMQKEYEKKQKILQANMEMAKNDLEATNSEKSSISQAIKKANNKVQDDKKEYQKIKDKLNDQFENAKNTLKQLTKKAKQEEKQAKKEKKDDKLKLSNVTKETNNTTPCISNQSLSHKSTKGQQSSIGI